MHISDAGTGLKPSHRLRGVCARVAESCKSLPGRHTEKLKNGLEGSGYDAVGYPDVDRQSGRASPDPEKGRNRPAVAWCPDAIGAALRTASLLGSGVAEP